MVESGGSSTKEERERERLCKKSHNERRMADSERQKTRIPKNTKKIKQLREKNKNTRKRHDIITVRIQKQRKKRKGNRNEMPKDRQRQK